METKSGSRTCYYELLFAMGWGAQIRWFTKINNSQAGEPGGNIEKDTGQTKKKALTGEEERWGEKGEDRNQKKNGGVNLLPLGQNPHTLTCVQKHKTVIKSTRRTRETKSFVFGGFRVFGPPKNCLNRHWIANAIGKSDTRPASPKNTTGIGVWARQEEGKTPGVMHKEKNRVKGCQGEWFGVGKTALKNSVELREFEKGGKRRKPAGSALWGVREARKGIKVGHYRPRSVGGVWVGVNRNGCSP